MKYANDTDGRGFLLGDDGRAHEIKVAGNVFQPPQVGIDAAELAALRRDAERYRWLKSDDVPAGKDCPAAYMMDARCVLLGDDLDAAIDAAMGE